jgi:two-component system copper resistance phosphate regulon response regulator CusR
MKVLIIEDEYKTADFIRKGLLENGYKVDVAYHGADGLSQAQSREYNIIILDIMLPGIDGWEVLHKLRNRENMTPVIYLSALNGLEDRIQGLKLGADDYIVKPFAFSELIARIQAVLRRKVSNKQSEIFSVGGLELDLAAYRVIRDGVRIELTPKEFTLLAFLMRFKGDVLTRTRIAERVWNLDDFHESNIVDVHIKRLRSKVDDPFKKKLIHSVRGVGYTLEDRG